MARPDPTDLEGIERERDEARKTALLQAKTEEGDIKWLMNDKRGRRIVKRFLERAGVFQTSFNTNAAQMAFNEGRRNEGLHMLAKIQQWAPEQYTVMMKESY